MFHAILERPPISPLRINPDTPLKLEDIIHKALEKDRNLRYQHASEMRADLQRLDRDTASGLERVGAISSRGAAIRQHRTGLALMVLVAVAALVAAGFGLHFLMTRTVPQPFQNFTVSQITNTGKAESAAISPDGKFIVNVQNNNGLQSLWLRNIVTASDTQITPPASAVYRSLAFSPDGNYVYFREWINASADLYRVPVLGGTPQRIVRDVVSNVTFSPDARRMAYVRANDPETGKFLLLSANPDGSDEKVLTVENMRNSDNNDCPRFVAWSNDGNMIALTFARFVETEVVKGFDLASRRFTLLCRLPNLLLFDVHFLPESNRLILAYSEKGSNSARRQIGVVSAAGDKVQPVTRDANSYSDLTLSADGKTAATVQVKTGLTLSITPFPASTGSTAPPSNDQVENVRAFDWTPNGHLIVSDGSTVERVRTDGAREAVLTSDPSAAVVSLARCTNSYVLLHWAFRAGKDAAIWRINADGTNPKLLSTGSNDSSPACSPDGKWVYYVDNLLTLKRVPLEGGQSESVPGSKVPNAYEDLGTADFSPDGRSLILVAATSEPVTNRARIKLAIVSLDSSPEAKPRLLDPEPRIGAGITAGSLYTGGAKFSPDGKAVVYDIVDRGVGNLWMQPLDGSPGHQITNFTSDRINGFRWSPDHKSLAVIREHLTSDVVVLHETTP